MILFAPVTEGLQKTRRRSAFWSLCVKTLITGLACTDNLAVIQGYKNIDIYKHQDTHMITNSIFKAVKWRLLPGLKNQIFWNKIHLSPVLFCRHFLFLRLLLLAIMEKGSGSLLCVHIETIDLSFHYFRVVFSLIRTFEKNWDKSNETEDSLKKKNIQVTLKSDYTD